MRGFWPLAAACVDGPANVPEDYGHFARSGNYTTVPDHHCGSLSDIHHPSQSSVSHTLIMAVKVIIVQR